MSQWITTWAQAHADMSMLCKNVKDYTARLTIISLAAGEQIRLRLSNQEGISNAMILGASVQIDGNVPTPLTFAGHKMYCLKPGESVHTDPLSFPVSAGDCLTISLAFKGTATSGNILPEAVRYSTKGNYTGSSRMPVAKQGMIVKLFNLDPVMPILSAVELCTQEKPEVLVCFGDSITQMSRWTKPLEEMLHYAGKNTVIINKGIGGNQLLSDPSGKNSVLYGIAGKKRFSEDVLAVEGATALLIALGVNDLNGAKDEAAAHGMADRLMQAYRELAEQARGAGMKVYVATITPSRGCKGYQPLCESERQKLNDMLRASADFDGVVDYDAAVRDPSDPAIMQDCCDSGDHVHPGVIGGRKLAMTAYNMLTRKDK